jgi:hypothetical protein
MDMMSMPRRFSFEQVLFFLAFLLALLVRFINLGVQPLTDLEARWALQALEIAKGNKPFLGTQPAYLLLTSVNFFIFGASNFLARFWPALAGAGLILAPAAFKKQLGQKAAILLAFALAFDPGLLALSRMAGGQMMAIGFVALSLAAWRSRKYPLAGALGGVALLCGPNAWFGLLGFGLTWAIFGRNMGFIWKSKIITARLDPDNKNENEPAGQKMDEQASTEMNFPAERINPLKTAFYWGLASLLLVGTLLFLVPNGLSAWAGSISDFIAGWWTPSSVKPWVLLISLLVYVPMAVIFGLVGLVRGIIKDDRVSIYLATLTAFFFVLALLYPARQAGDLAWMLVPLWALAAIELSRHMELIIERKWEIGLAGCVTFVFLVFAWLELLSIPSSLSNPTILQTRLFLMLGAMLLLILSMFLVAAGWDASIARLGVIWGGAIALLMFTVSAGMNAAGLRQPFSTELWQPGSPFVQADLLVMTANDLSDWRKGHIENLNISIPSDLGAPSVLWLFRDWHIEQVDGPNAADSPDLVILPQGVDYAFSAAYRGQDFVFRETPVWDNLPLNSWLRWLAYRELPVQSEYLVLWAREDLFLDSGAGLNTTNP